ARSEITLPGSWRRRRLHIGASASERASVSPEWSAISASRRLPAWVASPLPSAVIFNAGRHLVAFTWYVPSCLGSWCLITPFSLVRRAFSRIYSLLIGPLMKGAG